MISKPKQSELSLGGRRKKVTLGQDQKSVCAVKAKINRGTQKPNNTKMLISWASPAWLRPPTLLHLPDHSRLTPPGPHPSLPHQGTGRAMVLRRRDQPRPEGPFLSCLDRGFSSKSSWKSGVGEAPACCLSFPFERTARFGPFALMSSMEVGVDQTLGGRATLFEKMYSEYNIHDNEKQTIAFILNFRES